MLERLSRYETHLDRKFERTFGNADQAKGPPGQPRSVKACVLSGITKNTQIPASMPVSAYSMGI
ncbi:hypothetical protein [Caenimonas sp. SL110]|uniref:hypothetical protein n=1 Tax=Caenimonas sp. SL110 TaxID=1450524 RepID=UPI001872AE8F|nr:hypothetical protein [Caenimonas sp. SL110]